jgi:hypothetical protein
MGRALGEVVGAGCPRDWRRRLHATGCALLFLTIAQGVLAQGQPAAEALFRSGQEAADQGEWALACERFEESQRLESAPGTLLNLARCREALGQLATAWKRYREVVDKLPEADARRAYALSRERELFPRVPKLTLVRPDTDEELQVLLGEVALSSAVFGVALPLDPGQVTVTVHARGREPWSVNLSLEEGAHVEQQLHLGHQSPSRPVQHDRVGGEESDQGTSRGISPLGWTALGVGAAGLAAGVFGLVWSGVELGNVSAHCDAVGKCDAEGIEAGDRGRVAVAMSIAGLSVGAVGVVAGLALRRPRKTSDQQSAEPLQIGAAPIPGGAFFVVGGRL